MKQLLTIYFLIISTLGFGNALNTPAIQSVKLSPKTHHRVSIIDKIQCIVSSSRSVSICQGKTFFVQGKSQTKAGTYYDTLKTTLGCDSIITTTLAVNPTYYLQTITSICTDSLLINGRYIKTGGIYIDSFKNTLGCDSIIETKVIDLNHRGFVIATPFGPSFLQASVFADKYQWLDCDDNYAPIDSNGNKSAIMQTFHIPKKGRYAVEITINGCKDTSDCYGIASTINYAQLSNLKVYPNPASEQITIDLEEEYANISIDIITITGQVLSNFNYKNQKILTLNTQHLTEGIYLLRIKTNEKTTMVRVTIN